MKIKNPSAFVVLVFATLLFGYTFYKSYYSSFTHDESYTYNNYVTIKVSDIITYTNCPNIPNNHILNTLLMKASKWVFRNHEWSLRLPNLLAHLLFIYYSILWLRKLNNDVLFVAGFIVLNVNTYLLDFFSIARGYGLSASFIFVSFFYIWQYVSELKSKYVWLSFFMGALAVWSNFTSLNYYISLLTVYFIFLFGRNALAKKPLGGKIKTMFFQAIPAFIISIVLFKLIAAPLEVIKGNLFGSTDGFYVNTIRSVVFYSILYDNYDMVTKVSAFVIAVLVISACCYSYDLIKNRFSVYKSPHLVLLLITFFSGLSTVLQLHFLKTPLLENRTGLFYIVLFNICFVHFYYFILSRLQKKIIAHIIFCIYPVFLLLTFTYNFRPDYYLDWKYESQTKEMLSKLIDEHEHSSLNNGVVTLGITWLYEPSVNYYRNSQKLHWLEPVTREGYDKDFDYYYVYNDSAFIKNKNLVILRKFETSNSILAKHP